MKFHKSIISAIHNLNNKKAIFTFGLLSDLSTVSRPMIYMVLIDSIINHAGMDTVFLIIAALAVITVLDSLLGYLKDDALFCGASVSGLERSWTFWLRVLSGRVRRSIALTRSGVAETGTRAPAWATARANAAYAVAADIPVSILLVGLMFLINPWMAAALLVSIPPAFGISAYFRKRREELSRRALQSSTNLRATSDDMLRGHDTLLTLSAHSFAFGEIWRALNHLTMSRTLQQRSVYAASRLSSAVQQIFGLVVLLVAAVFVINGSLSLGALIAFDMIAGQLRGKALSISQALSAHADWEPQIIDMEGIEGSFEDFEAPNILLPEPRVAITMENVTFCYKNGENVLNNVSCEMRFGNMYAVVGSSGAGKSTFGRIAASILTSEGVVSYSHRLNAGPPVLYLSQDPFLFSGSVMENILLERISELPSARKSRLEQSARRASIDPSMLDMQVGEAGRFLSGGQRQRVHLARAFNSDAQIIIVDEPTSSLDPNSRLAIAQELRELAREGRCVIAISHDSEIVERSDTLIEIDKGSLIAEELRDRIRLDRRC